MKIKTRITIWYTLFLLGVVAAVLVFMFLVGSYQTKASSQESVAHEVDEAFDDLEMEHGKLDMDDVDYLSRGVYISIFDNNGEFMGGITPEGFDSTTPLSHGESRELGEWCVYDIHREVPKYGELWVRGVSSISHEGKVLEALLWISITALPFLAVLGAAGGFFITKKAFDPVKKITATANSIGESRDLSRRIGLKKKQRDEIYELARAFDKMFDRLQQAFENEKQFTSDASHELRTPTSVIMAQCEYALENGNSQEEYRQALESVLGETKKMTALISQLLTLARADRAHEKMCFELVDMSELVEMVAEQQRESASEKGITVEYSIEPGLNVRGDETMLMRVLINLCQNAVKYGREGGMVHLALRREADTVMCSVSDDGIGIAPENLEKIWDRFYQEDPSRSKKGAGLGLSMVKWIVEAHGGKIDARSKPGKGSVFSFFIPYTNFE